MKNVKRSSLIALLCAFNFLLPAQNILLSYSKCDSLFVCSTDTFTIKVQNNHASDLIGGSLTVALPSGLTYVPGAITGAAEQNINNLAFPIFNLPVIPANQSVSIKILLSADCLAADVLDAGQLFIAQLAVASALGNAQISTTSIPVETGAIVITSVTGQLLMGERGDTLVRTICVKNTRLGKIGRLHFEDSHQDGYEAFISGSASQTQSGTFYTAIFDGNIFETVGNMDQWLDQNESICLTERIIINSCGTPAFTNTSLLRMGWGCGGTKCRYDSTTAFIEIKPSTKVPALVFEQVWAPPTDYCGNTPAVMGYKIKNIGLKEATDIIFNVTLIDGLSTAVIGSNTFRVVTSNGVTPINPNVSTPNTLQGCNLTGVRDGSFLIPILSANDSILFLFDVFTCPALCTQVQPTFRADYFYKKDCPVNGFVSGNSFILPEKGYKVQGDLESNIGTCLESGQSYPFFYKAISRYLKEPGFWHLVLDLPHGITQDTTCLTLLGGVAPVLSETTPLLNGGVKIHLAWATPFAFDTLGMNLCLRYICDTNIVCTGGTPDPNGGIIYTDFCCLLKMNDQTYWSTELNTDPICAINDCNEKVLAVNLSCVVPGDDGNPPPPGVDNTISTPGLLNWWNVYRLNVGYQDVNDDRHADQPLMPASNQIRRDRFIPGDTLRVEFCGYMDSLSQVDTIGRAIWHEITGSDMLLNGNDPFSTLSAKNDFTDFNKIRLINTQIRIHYADGSMVNCNWDGLLYKDDKNYFQVVNPNTFPPIAIDDIASEKFYFLYSLPAMFASGCIPKPVLELGDSIFILNDFKIDTNFKPNSTNDPDPPLVGFRTTTSSGGNLFAWNTQPFQPLQYSGWKKYISPNTHSIKPCENSSEVKKFRYSMRIARENMFPFEVRPLAWISDYVQTVPDGLELTSAKMEYLSLQDSVPFLGNIQLPFAQSPGLLDIDFAPAFTAPVDEGFTLRNSLSFKPDCHFNRPDTSRQYIETSFFGCLNGDHMSVLDSVKNQIGFYSNTPGLRLLSADSIVYAPSRNFELNFSLKNLFASSAPAAWIALVSPSGQVSDYELYQMPQNQAIAGTNGLFNLGTVNGVTTLNFRLKGKEKSCENDSLLLIYGWDCGPINGLSGAGCGRDTFLIQIQLERPELELEILQEPASITLCAPSDWFEFEVYNAKIGYAYALKASAKLPSGMSIVPGSCQISYPEGAPWINIADPSLLSGNLFQWELNSISSVLANNGLPGVNLNPLNSVHIRFKTLAECGFVANTPIIYGTTGMEPCGRQANVLNKPGDPLNIIGLNPSYGVQISLLPQGNTGVACGATQSFSVNLNILGTPEVGDSIYILLPQGVTIVNNSYTPGQNAPVGPPVLNAGGFALALPGLQGGGAMQFSFALNYGALAGCNDQTIIAQTRVKTQAFCQSLGGPCTVYVSTGEASWSISPPHPQLLAGTAMLTLSNGLISGSLMVTNIGMVTASGVIAQIWRDIDGNAALSANDLLIGTLLTALPLTPGATTQLSGDLPGLDSTQLCGLLIILPAEENCTCDDQVFSLNLLTIQHTIQYYCNLQDVNVGIPGQAGSTYQWQPASGIVCSTCPNTTYQPDPASPPNSIHTLILTENTGSCTITHRFDLRFGEVATVETLNAVICAGKSTTLQALPLGSSYLWEGPGLLNASSPTQVVQPSVSSIYSVTITYATGCTATAAAEISVLQADTVILNGLSTCAGVPVNVLGNSTATPGTYKLILSKINGCDSTLFQTLSVTPNMMTEEQRVFCLGGSTKVYDSTFTTSGTLCRSYSTSTGCDSTHCVYVTAIAPPQLTPQDTIFGTFGQIITLTGPGGFVTYIWQPAPTPACLNCPSVSYPADSTGYHEYLLTVAGADGCPADLLFRVLVFPPCSADSLRIPNAFTPNGDGANDVFRVVSHEGAEVVSSLEIYDRWGEKVYENQGDAFWDGTIKGQPAPMDVYVYIVRVNCGELVGKRVGDVTLIR